MEILDSYEFTRPSTSRYAPVVQALVNDNKFAVKLKRGEDFPEDATIATVQGAVSQQIRNAGRNARTFAESDDVLVVTLRSEEEATKAKRSAKRRVNVPA